MSFADKIISLLNQKPGLTDREITDVLKGSEAHPSQINSEARLLMQKGFLTRAKRHDGKLGNFLTGTDLPIVYPSSELSSSANAQADWFWEGNVQEKLASHLQRNGWALVSVSNTASKEQGIDIHAEKMGKTLLIEVKGYPSKSYNDPRRSHEKKKTSPTLQAGHWYSHAILKSMRLLTEYPEAQIVIGIPDFRRYRDLFKETKSSLDKLGFQVWGVDEMGKVENW